MKEQKQLICKKCKDDTLETRKRGCSVCGGFRVIANLLSCPTCGRTGYFRPGAETSYAGKHFYSIDGLEMVITELGKSKRKMVCIHCYGKDFSDELKNL